MAGKHLQKFPVTISHPIAWGEMDAFQHVNNIMYFRYFESARIAYLERIDFLDYHVRTGLGPILASTQCRFRAPLSYPDQVTVGTRVSNLESDRFTMDYLVISQKRDIVAAEGQGVVVSFDYKGQKKVPMPTEIRERIVALEADFGNIA